MHLYHLTLSLQPPRSWCDRRNDSRVYNPMFLLIAIVSNVASIPWWWYHYDIPRQLQLLSSTWWARNGMQEMLAWPIRPGRVQPGSKTPCYLSSAVTCLDVTGIQLYRSDTYSEVHDHRPCFNSIMCATLQCTTSVNILVVGADDCLAELFASDSADWRHHLPGPDLQEVWFCPPVSEILPTHRCETIEAVAI